MTIENKELTCEEQLEAALSRIKELQEIERKKIEFQTASQIPTREPVRVIDIFIPAGKMVSLWQQQRGCIDKANVEKRRSAEQDYERRIIFRINPETGEIQGCKLED